MTTDSTELKPPRPQRPYLPVAGFWARGLALAADAMLLGAVFYILIFLAKDALFALGRWNVLLSGAIIIFYFALGDGPVGKGRTVGKFLAGVRVTDYEGGTVSLPAALMRSVLKSVVVILSLPLTLYFSYLEQTAEISPVAVIAVSLVQNLLLFIMVFYCLHIGFSPLKQAPYDFLSRTLTFKQEEIGTREKLVALYESPQALRRLQKGALLWPAFISVGLFSMLTWQVLKDIPLFLGDAIRLRREFMTSLHSRDLGYPLRFLDIPVQGANGGPSGATPAPNASTAAAAGDAATSPPQAGVDRPRHIQVQYRAPRRASAAELEVLRPHLMEQLIHFRTWVQQNAELGKDLQGMRVVSYQLALVRQIPFVIRPFSENMLVLEIPNDALPPSSASSPVGAGAPGEPSHDSHPTTPSITLAPTPAN